MGKEEDIRVALAIAVHGEEILAATDLDFQVERGLFARLGPYWSGHPTRLADRNNLSGTSDDSLAETSWNIRGRVRRGRNGRLRLWRHQKKWVSWRLLRRRLPALAIGPCIASDRRPDTQHFDPILP